MKKEAELHAEEDKQRRDEIEVRNTADSLAYQAEKTVRENSDKIGEELKTSEEVIKQLVPIEWRDKWAAMKPFLLD